MRRDNIREPKRKEKNTRVSRGKTRENGKEKENLTQGKETGDGGGEEETRVLSN